MKMGRILLLLALCLPCGCSSPSPTQEAKGDAASSTGPTIKTDHRKLADAGAFADILGDDLTAKVEDKEIAFACYSIGPLRLPSGRVVACDGFIWEGLPFERTLPPGEYPVLVAVARLGDDERIAFARIQCTDAKVVRWAMATCPGQDATSLKKDEIFGYGVDSGIGAFMALEAIGNLEKMGSSPELFTSRLIDEMEKTYRSTRDWARIETKSGNGVLFSSGYGDGFYASYFGFDAQGQISALVTDFGIIDWTPIAKNQGK
jgi:hypothetical protein